MAKAMKQGGAPEVIELPEPAFARDCRVFEALKLRRTTREIGEGELGLQALSDLLWAAGGVNRAEGPFGRPGITAGSASAAREIRIYVLLEEGAYLYEGEARKLRLAAAGDLRPLAIGRGQAPAGAHAPARLVYVADLARFAEAGFQEPGLRDPEIQAAYYHVDAGMAAANVYLAAAAQGLAAWFHNCDKEGLSRALGLGPGERPLFGQTLGYPARDGD